MAIKTVSTQGIKLTEQQKFFWLQLSRCENIGPVTFKQLIRRFGTAENALLNLPEMIAKVGARKIKIAQKTDIEKELEQIEKFGAKIICMGEPDYPHTLRLADGAPPVITAIGNVDTLCKKSVAFVGSRNASISGMKLTATLAQEIAYENYTIVSGFARGIDTSAHRAALKTGTVAVFAGGIDHIYPQENETLRNEIIENNGAIISETPMGWKPRPQDFPRRNRIVAGLALAVIVVEAAQKSGSLISARLAAEMGRLVLAVPGSPLDPRSQGANNLIRDGAILATNAKDILEALAPIDETATQNKEFYLQDSILENMPAIETEPAKQEQYEAIRNHLSYTPVDIDELIRFTGFSTQQVHEVIIALQIAGELERHGGNKISLLQ